MKIDIAGEDCTGTLGPALREAAQARRDRVNWPQSRFDDVLALRGARSEAGFQERFLELLAGRNATHVYGVPAAPGRGPLGRLGYWLKCGLWLLLRYQHARMAAMQNGINILQTSALTFERELWQRRCAELEARLRKLETGAGDAAGDGDA